MRKDNFNAFMPDMSTFDGQMPVMPLTYEFLFRVETKIKLDIKMKDGTSIIKNPDEKEFHFVQFEGLVENYQVSIKQIARLITEFSKNAELKFQEWTITDLDHHLNGNPHVTS